MMKTRFAIGLIGLLGCGLVACNQPFEPDGPTNNRLVLYSILNSSSTTQYVRLSATYATPPAQEFKNATVRMLCNGKTIVFRDTTVLTTDESGRSAPINAYVAYNTPITGGNTYELTAATASGLAASAQATALSVPAISLVNRTALDGSSESPVTLNTAFNSLSGAYELHFYVDFYALVDGGWELIRAEVPSEMSVDAQGSPVKVFPKLRSVKIIAQSTKAIPLQYDVALYSAVRAEMISRYAAAPVVWLRAVFVLTQIDDVLYSYYYVANGSIDKSSVRLDQPDYTNISGGLGVFGSSVTVTATYPINR
jgi:hypothetical protein